MLPFTGNKNLILNWVLKPDLERQTFRGIQKNSNLKFWTLNSLDYCCILSIKLFEMNSQGKILPNIWNSNANFSFQLNHH